MKIDRTLLRRSWDSWVALDIERAGPYWLQLVWTGALSMLVALGFTVLNIALHAHAPLDWPSAAMWPRWFGKYLVVCLIIGYTIHAAFELGGRLIGGPARYRGFAAWQRMLFFGGIPIVSVTLALPLGLALVGAETSLRPVGSADGLRAIVIGIALTLLVTFVSYQWFAAKTRAIAAEREAAEAQLRLLQAQIEPHFLFNTLANVHALIENDAPKAKRVLGAFTDYLRAGLGHLRRESGPLADELALAEAYLRVQQARMAERLAFEIDADEPARRAALPPLLLQPLVENAVQHGIEPRLEGGRVVVRARVPAGRLVIEVRDDGPSPGAAPARRGHGVALANVRARLASRFGNAAELELAEAAPGTLARLTLPLEPA